MRGFNTGTQIVGVVFIALAIIGYITGTTPADDGARGVIIGLVLFALSDIDELRQELKALREGRKRD